MKNFLGSLYFLFPSITTIILLLLPPIPSAQLTTTETTILLQLQTLLEFPKPLQNWNNLTNFCNISSSQSLTIICTKNHVTELTIIGNRNNRIQRFFSTDSFFNVLTKLSNLKVLSLVSLGLWGPLPSKIINFNSLEVFNISSNFFNGSVPSILFSLPLLKNLNLASNQFTGSISLNISCGGSLTFVDISHNFLEGKLPSCIDSKSLNRTVLYSGNCLLTTRNLSDQHPSSYCKKSTVLALKPRFKRRNESNMQLGVLFGIIGGFVGIAGLMILIFVFILIKSKSERKDSKIDKYIDISRDSRPNIYARSNVSKLMRLNSIGLQPYKIFTIKEIEDATNNFDSSNLVSEGSQGQLYKGRLRDGSMIMVNLVKLKQKNLSKINENVKVLHNLRHGHLVSVVGHCVLTCQDHPNIASTIFIVFERISNMSLRICLTDKRKKEMQKWQQRMAIIIGIARGIKFLHTGINPGIFGNNIKIENILLDNSLNPKVSGYSIPFPSNKSSERKLKDQNARNHIGSINNAEKEDIYQFGVILLEVITGKLITSSIEVDVLKYELGRCLSEVASPTALRSAIDPLLHETYKHESLKTAVQITINCLNKVPGNRPSIEDIIWNLQYSMQVEEARSSKTST